MTPHVEKTKLAAAIAKARFVYETLPEAGLVIDYFEQLLMAGAPAPAETGIVPGAENASIAKETYTPLGAAPTVVAGSEWPAWARQLDKVTVDVERIAGYAGDVVREMANILGTVGADTFDQAAAAMAAESAEMVADAERSAARTAVETSFDPLTILSREVFGLSNKLQQPADITVQLLVLAELRLLKAFASQAKNCDRVSIS